jgi:hypothetical protein
VCDGAPSATFDPRNLRPFTTRHPRAETNVSISLLERRQNHAASTTALRYAITEDQREALQVLEKFGWSLRFVRRNVDREPVAWVYDPDHRRLAVIEPDGTLVEGTVPAHRN